MNSKTFLLAICASLMLALPAASQEVAFVIRHAEKESVGKDPALTAAGRGMAQDWSNMLKESGVEIVIHTDARRSRETGNIIASELGVEQAEVSMADIAGLFDLLTFDYDDQNVLIIAHTETIPTILARMGVQHKVDIATEDYRNLFLVTSGPNDQRVLTQLRLP
jgi:broad specificity phosphatase PhoE